MDRIRTGLLALAILSSCSSDLRAEGPARDTIRNFVALSIALGILSGFGSAVVDADATGTSRENLVWAATHLGEGHFRAFFFHVLSKLMTLSEDSLGISYHLSRIASYVSYYFTYNKRITAADQRIGVRRCIEKFFQPLFYLAVPTLFFLPLPQRANG